MHVALIEPGREHADYTGGGHDAGQPSAASVARDVWQGAFRTVERERQKSEARSRLAKIKELRKREIMEYRQQQGYYQDHDV